VKLTNKYNLPELFMIAAGEDDYNPGHGDISVTSLIAPAQQRRLRLEHDEETTEDVSDRVWAIFGTAVHYHLEKAVIGLKKRGKWNEEEDFSERRFYGEFNNKLLSAQIDLCHKKVLTDFKVTSVYKIKDSLLKGNPDWTAQLNIQKRLMVMNGIEVGDMYILAFSRDWNESARLRDNEYPAKVEYIPIPEWTDNELNRYINDRMYEHFDAPDPKCTSEEIWEKEHIYALMKSGRKSAIRNLQTEDAVMDYAEAHGFTKTEDGVRSLKSGYSIEYRKPERIRCERYCNVAPFCPQHQEWLKK